MLSCVFSPLRTDVFQNLPQLLRRATRSSLVKREGRAGEVWLGNPCVFVAWAGLFVACVTPPHGTGLTLCWIKASTGLPCPGCGLTRSLSCALRGMFVESWHYHPLGMLILLLFILTAGASAMPRLRNALVHYIERRRGWFERIHFVFVIAFVGFGAVRVFFHLREIRSLAGLD